MRMSYTVPFFASVLLIGIQACKPQIRADTVAMVNGSPITAGYMMESFRNIPTAMQNNYRREGGKRRFLDSLIQQRIIVQVALKEQGSTSNVESLSAKDQQTMFNSFFSKMLQTSWQVTPEEIESAKDSPGSSGSSLGTTPPNTKIPVAARLQQAKIKNWIAQQRAKAQVTINTKALESLSL